MRLEVEWDFVELGHIFLSWKKKKKKTCNSNVRTKFKCKCRITKIQENGIASSREEQ